LRSRLVTVTFVLIAAVAWLVLAPTGIGGSTDYVTTNGDSMAPRFHTGDLALIRPADQYRVGEVVAYRSTLLHTVVLHRIIGRDGDRYVFKGDNNDFVDPTHPGRGEMIGRLWLRVPRGGLMLGWLRIPVVVASLAGGAALLLLLGVGHRRRRRDRRRPGAPRPRQGDRPVVSPRPPAVRAITAQHVLTACGVAAAALLLLGLLAFTRPATKAATVKSSYTEKVSFGYHAAAAPGPVYPGGVVKTGDPVFLRLVDHVRVTVGYRFAAAAPHRLAGTMEVLVRLTSQTGWTRSLPLASPTRFAGDYARSSVTLNLPRLRSLIGRVETLTGTPAGGDYTLAVVPRVHLTGTLAGQLLSSDYAPALSFQLGALQLRPGSAPATSSSDDQHDGLTPSRRATVATTATAPNTLGIGGHGLPVATARWIALAGLLLAAATALLTRVRQRRRPSDPAAHIQARYGHLIVPIAGMTHYPTRPPIDVTSITALVALAERSERLILHHQRDDGDTYLVDDEGTLYRYQTRPTDSQQPPAPPSPDHATRNASAH
jgi:signal peptidase I